MAKLDSQHRLIIPKKVMKICNIDFEEELRIFFHDNMYFIANPSPKYLKCKCFGRISLDCSNRFNVPKIIISLLKLTPGDNISFFAYDEKVVFEKFSI